MEMNSVEKELYSHIKYKQFKTLNEVDDKVYEAAVFLCKKGLAFYISNGPLRQLRISEYGEMEFNKLMGVGGGGL